MHFSFDEQKYRFSREMAGGNVFIEVYKTNMFCRNRNMNISMAVIIRVSGLDALTRYSKRS